MAGNSYASTGQRTNAFAAPARALASPKPKVPGLPSTTPSAGFDKTMSVPKPRPMYVTKLQRQPQFGNVPRSKFSVVNSGLK